MFGPTRRSLVLALGYGAHVNGDASRQLLADIGVRALARQVARLLVEGHDRWHAEASAIADAALADSPWRTLDDTPTRVDARNRHCQVLTSSLATVHRTTPGKGRLTVLNVLRNGQRRTLALNEQTTA